MPPQAPRTALRDCWGKKYCRPCAPSVACRRDSWASGTVPDLGASRLPMVGSMGGVGPQDLQHPEASNSGTGTFRGAGIAHGNMPMLPCLVPMAGDTIHQCTLSLSPDSPQRPSHSAPGTDPGQLPWPGQETAMLDWVSEFKLCQWEPLFGLSISKQDCSGPSGGRGTKKPAPRTLWPRDPAESCVDETALGSLWALRFCGTLSPSAHLKKCQ